MKILHITNPRENISLNILQLDCNWVSGAVKSEKIYINIDLDIVIFSYGLLFCGFIWWKKKMLSKFWGFQYFSSITFLFHTSLFFIWRMSRPLILRFTNHCAYVRKLFHSFISFLLFCFFFFLSVRKSDTRNECNESVICPFFSVSRRRCTRYVI